MKFFKNIILVTGLFILVCIQGGTNTTKAKMYAPGTIKENFGSIGGLFSAKQDLKEIVDVLKNPEKYKKMGTKVPQGVLLIGPPGNGKTSLARAIAGETNRPFFSVSGIDIHSPQDITTLFNEAQKHAPCIVFIDEIDQARGMDKLLTILDGFEKMKNPVICIGATNYLHLINPALLRPGRFDRKINVERPTLDERKEILSLHIKNIKIADNLDLDKIVRVTAGLSAAELSYLVNEASFVAIAQNKNFVEVADFFEACIRLLLSKNKNGF